MSILIKGMEMPNSCRDCPISGEWYCNALPSIPAWHKEYVASIEGQTRMDRCPLVPIPPHGRLIDADALVTSFKGSIEECHKWANEIEGGEMYARVSQALGTFVECSLRTKNAPTIIEAER